MAPARRPPSDWSDSDSDDEALDGQVETSVLLGVPDGPVAAEADRTDAAVSRIGGLPALLPAREPPFASSHCGSCARPMELLVQMWCPFEDSPMDRALYVWGCARAGCQRKDGSIRAFRGLRTNDAYAQKLAQKRARQAQRAEAAAAARKLAEQKDKAQREKLFQAGGGNPFTMVGAATAPNAFGAGFGLGSGGGGGIGAQIFGGVDKDARKEELHDDDDDSEDDNERDEAEDEAEESEDEDDEKLLTALAATSLHDSAWRAAPAYAPLYLSTVAEYVPPEPRAKAPRDADALLDGDDDDRKGGKGGKGGGEGWATEAYENSMDVDAVFERFMRRAACEGEQCVRYELNGTPLPFASSDAAFDLLWPGPSSAPQPGDLVPVTKQAPNAQQQQQQRRTYAGPARVARCPACGARRVFECQLMPNLINVLRASASSPDAPEKTDAKETKETKKEKEREEETTDEERRAAVRRALAGQDKDARSGMEWGTCMVFSCERDCCVDDAGQAAREAWREEAVLVQWDT